jgi:hypothetical protein
MQRPEASGVSREASSAVATISAAPDITLPARTVPDEIVQRNNYFGAIHFKDYFHALFSQS